MPAEAVSQSRQGGYSLEARLRRQPDTALVPAVDLVTHTPPGDVRESSPDRSLSPGVDLCVRLLAAPRVRQVIETVREVLTDSKGRTQEENDRRLRLFHEVQAGDARAEIEAKAQIAQVLQMKKLTIPDVPESVVVDLICDVCWGLDLLAPIYRDPTVDEIRVNGPSHIYTVRRGRNHREPISFPDDDHVIRIMRRLITHDRVDITRDRPRVETTRLDGCRVTLAIPPFTRHASMAIRKFSSMSLDEGAFLANRSVNERLLRVLRVLARGRASILLSGGTGTGKTTLLRLLVGYLPPYLRLLTLESDFELHLENYYPDRDVISLQAQTDLDPPLTLQEAFKTVLRLTPDAIIMGEARSSEFDEAVKAAIRGHDGSMSTVHVSSVLDVVPAVCAMILEEKPARPIQVLREQVASAYQIIVQLVRWPSGRKMVEEVCEMSWDARSGEVVYNPLVVWKGSDDNPEEGDWEFPNPASERLIARLKRGGVRPRELREAGLLWE